MSDSLILNMTDAGRLAMLNHVDNGFDLTLVSVKLGSGNYKADAMTSDLHTPWAEFPLISGMVDTDNFCLNFIASGQVQSTIKISEIGLFDQNGLLFAVVSKESGQFFETEKGTFFNLNFSVGFDQSIAGNKIKLSFWPQDAIFTALLALHVQHKDAHPQYKRFIQDLFKHHIQHVNPHNQYAMRDDVQNLIEQYIDRIKKLSALFLSFFSTNMIGAVTESNGSLVVTLPSAVKWALTSLDYCLFFNAEGGHEAWGNSRQARGFNASIFNRSGTSRVGYSGKVDWLLLDKTDNPISGLSIPGLIKADAVASNGSLFIPKVENTPAFKDAVIIINFEGGHEGWSIGRAENGFSVNVFNRSGTSRIGASGNLNYMLLKPKNGQDEDGVTSPCLLMCGVSEVGSFNIMRPDNKDWDFTKSDYAIFITPEGGHEAWGISRAKDKFFIDVFNRSGTNRVGYSGKVNWAIFKITPKQNFTIYYEGTYTLKIKPGASILVDLFAAGGGGGGSVYTGGNTVCPGTKGGHTALSFGTKLIQASGGNPGNGGWWGNGSHMSEGWGGAASDNVIRIDGMDTLSMSVISNVPGNAGIVNRWSPQTRTAGRVVEGVDVTNYGGAGGWGIGSESRAGGGSGASGGFVRGQLKNIGKEEIEVTLTVGATGKGWNQYGNAGENGGPAFALVYD